MVFWVFNYVIKHTTIAALINFPFPFQLKVGIRFIGYNIAACIAFGRTLANQRTINNCPVFNLSFFVKAMPALQAFAIKQIYPWAFFRGCLFYVRRYIYINR